GGATVNYGPVTATDACAGTLTATCSPASGSAFPVGTTTVTCTASDGHGNTGSCAFTVTVVDTQPPTVNCPANITAAECNNGSGGTTVNYGTVTATDACAGTLTATCSPASGSTFPLGTTTVTCTAGDGHGNTGTCNFTVTVVDTQPPTVSCPANITTANDAGKCSAKVTFT